MTAFDDDFGALPTPTIPAVLGATVRLTGADEVPAIAIPDGWHEVTAVNDDGSFCVDGGDIVVWPIRIAEVETA